ARAADRRHRGWLRKVALEAHLPVVDREPLLRLDAYDDARLGALPADVLIAHFFAEVAVCHRSAVLLAIRRLDRDNGSLDADVFVRGRFGLRTKAHARAFLQ